MTDTKVQTDLPNSEVDSSNAALMLSMVEGIGPRTYQHLVDHFGSPEQVLSADPSELRAVPGVGAKVASKVALALSEIDLKPQLELCRQHDIRILDLSNEGYPAPLKEIYDPPSILYAHGEYRREHSIAVAIVGSRHATRYGLKMAESLGRSLAMAGFTVVSGLARGIDAAAHRGAISGGGQTIAVLGSGLLNIYPPEHQDLAKEVAASGCVLSEYLPYQSPKSGAFPARNRIVSGLSLGVVVVEAADRSGALISARHATEQGREVFAVPGRADSRMSRGCHALIRDGAKLVESIDDIIEELGPLATPAEVTEDRTIRHPAELKLTEQESLVLQFIETDPTGIDEVVERTELPVARVLSTISILEIRRLVRRVSGNKVLRI